MYKSLQLIPLCCLIGSPLNNHCLEKEKLPISFQLCSWIKIGLDFSSLYGYIEHQKLWLKLINYLIDYQFEREFNPICTQIDENCGIEDVWEFAMHFHFGKWSQTAGDTPVSSSGIRFPDRQAGIKWLALARDSLHDSMN